MLKVGIIREGKVPPDTRVPFSPSDVSKLKERYPNISIEIQSSANRCFKDQEYEAQGVTLQDKIDTAEVLFGVKEVPIDELIPNKTYFFFSHTKKKQAYNQKLMHALIEKRITMIDYEALVDDNGDRIIGFGFYAGVVGAHNGLLTYGRKHELYHLKAAHQCRDYQEMISQYKSIALPSVKIAVTGSGRVAKGVWDIMNAAGIHEVSAEDYKSKNYDHPVWVRLTPDLLFAHKESGEYERSDFHHHPEKYKSLFSQYTAHTDLLMNGIYWSEEVPKLFEKSDIQSQDFKISVISDITCDIDGSVPINVGASTIANPVYGIDRNTMAKVAPFVNSMDTIDIMAVDNLPNELARDASEHFGDALTAIVIPELLLDNSAILDRATICKNGKLTKYFEYLSEYAYTMKETQNLQEIQMVDLKKQYLPIKDEILAGLNEVMDNTSFIQGPQVKRFAQELAAYLEVKEVIPCANGTDALQIALMALDLQPGDEVITPSFTYIATVEVVALLGLKPVFVDVDANNYNVLPAAIESAITPRTKAIIPVHLYGQSAPMEEILDIGSRHNIPIIEDCAQALGGSYTFSDGSIKKNGTMGLIGCTSFFPSKNLGAYGDGGAMFTNDSVLADKLRMIANHGQQQRYKHDIVGCNSRLDSMQAVVLSAKLKRLDDYCEARRKAAAYYDTAFSNHELISVPFVAPYSRHVYHQYTLTLHESIDRDALIAYLSEQGIPSMIYYPIPSHKQKMFSKLDFTIHDMTNTDFLTPRVISLPMHTELDDVQLSYIVKHVLLGVDHAKK